MNIKDLGYYLYMEEQEKISAREREAAVVREYKVNSNNDLVQNNATHSNKINSK